MILFPFLDLLLVLLALQVVALVAQRLEVGAVVEPVGADGPRDDMVHAGGRPDDSLAVAFSAERMLYPEGPGQPRPPCGVVGIGGALADVSFALLNPVRIVPRKPCHDSSFDSHVSGIRSCASCP